MNKTIGMMRPLAIAPFALAGMLWAQTPPPPQSGQPGPRQATRPQGGMRQQGQPAGPRQPGADQRGPELVGFLFDTTLAAAKLVFAGVPERYPNIKWVLSHLGGAIPYLAERLDRGWKAFPDCRVQITRPPSEYLRRFYFD
ncbi:MAG: hypothetical protein ABI823_18735, partial [Bryobacteraceae bacterium]